jgi:hypothetical protein
MRRSLDPKAKAVSAQFRGGLRSDGGGATDLRQCEYEQTRQPPQPPWPTTSSGAAASSRSSTAA